MKSLHLILAIMSIFPISGLSQEIELIDEVNPNIGAAHSRWLCAVSEASASRNYE